MDFYRLRHTVRLMLIRGSVGRAEYIKKKDIFYHMGENCSFMGRKIPLYPKLISLGNNVWTASNVNFVTHDAIHNMLSRKYHEKFVEKTGCIQIDDNVFIGANSIILSGVHIGSNTIIGAGSLVTKSLPGGYVWGGTC